MCPVTVTKSHCDICGHYLRTSSIWALLKRRKAEIGGFGRRGFIGGLAFRLLELGMTVYSRGGSLADFLEIVLDYPESLRFGLGVGGGVVGGFLEEVFGYSYFL